MKGGAVQSSGGEGQPGVLGDVRVLSAGVALDAEAKDIESLCRC